MSIAVLRLNSICQRMAPSASRPAGTRRDNGNCETAFLCAEAGTNEASRLPDLVRSTDLACGAYREAPERGADSAQEGEHCLLEVAELVVTHISLDVERSVVPSGHSDQ